MVSLVTESLSRNGSNADWLIRQEVEECLRTSSFLQLRTLRCENHGKVIVLRGQVDSFYLKQLAQEAVKKLAPHTRIANLVTVG